MVSNYSNANRDIDNITKELGNTMAIRFNYINNTASSTFIKIRDSISRNIAIARDNVSNHLNSIAYMFKNFDATLKVKIPHFYMTGQFNAETREVPRVGVNYFAKGGIVDRATLGIIGEAGREAVVPLENNTGGLDLLANKLLERMPRGSNNSGSSDKPITLVLKVGQTELGRAVIESLNEIGRQNGGEIPINI